MPANYSRPLTWNGSRMTFRCAGVASGPRKGALVQYFRFITDSVVYPWPRPSVIPLWVPGRKQMQRSPASSTKSAFEYNARRLAKRSSFWRTLQRLRLLCLWYAVQWLAIAAGALGSVNEGKIGRPTQWSDPGKVVVEGHWECSLPHKSATAPLRRSFQEL